MAQNNSNPVRLYTRFISILRVVQYFGYFVVVVLSLFLFLVTAPAVMYGFGNAANLYLIYILLQAGVGCVIVYVVTQALIAIIDLLSRIEQSTRSE